MKRFAVVPYLRAGILSAALVLTGLAGCVSTGNPYKGSGGSADFSSIPVDQLREVADEIERAVQAGNREPNISNREALVVDSEEVVQAIRTRAARSELIGEFRTTGHAVEERDGLLHILRSEAYKKSGTRRTRDRDAVLVMGENENRWSIYEGILKASDLPAKSLGAIQAIFTEARIVHLGPGEKYENEMGQRVSK